jgi:NitT/TauT family transport system permease protein
MGWFKSVAHKYLAIIVFLIAWQIFPTIGLVNEIFIPTPTTILAEIWKLTLDGTLPNDAVISLFRVGVGFGIALLVALPLGFLLGGFFKSFEKAVNPLLQLLSQANPFTLFPIFIVFLGIGEVSKISIIYWVCQWPILLNTITGISNVDPVLIKMARSSGLSKAEIFTKVLIPASLPTVFTGIRMGAAFSFFMLIGAEMLGSSAGLGYLIMQAQMVMQIPRMWAGIVVVALIGYIVTYSLIYLERRGSVWKQEV